jgi:predicted O-methyltransferase YrrM
MGISCEARMFGDDAARFALAALSGPFLPWSSGAMRPAGLVEVCNDIVLNDRRRIVELGSGISTVLLARLLGQSSAPAERRLAAVEHDARWSRWVVDQLAREGLGDHVAVVDAPLRARTAGQGGWTWYDEAAIDAGLDAAIGDDVIDLLVVDGPPAFAVGLALARYPALPELRDRLAPGATVVLDDVERPGEQEVLRRWEAEFGLVFRREERHAGVAIASVA